MNNAVETKNLSKSFGKKRALYDVSIAIPENSITGLIGRNGSGKTTLMKILSGNLDKTKGESLIFGEEPMDNLKVLNKLVYAYHNIAYDPSWTLSKILFGYKTMFSGFDEIFAEKLIRFFDMNVQMKYKNLSQGMTSVFNFICALSCRAPLTMLDEPVLGMDITVRKSVYEILLRDFIENPRTFIISSHLLSEIEGILSNILLIEQGKALLNLPIDEMRQSAYRVDGSLSKVNEYVSGKNVIGRNFSELSNFAIIYEKITDEVVESAKNQGLSISPLRAEELCVFLTQKNKGDEFECLW
ncbi:MAG: ABC transporter ATP-binding protein [Defluviitaleaceae bacterium]|nr:ABC transporter ATP-binding protein [Defluviitaleaceae bacterium]